MRGQIPQLFIFLAALLVIGTTVFVGAKFVLKINAVGCEASDAAFLQELNSLLTDNAAFGSRNRVTLSPNCDAVTICFVNSTTDLTSFTGATPAITASVRGGGQANIFLLTRDTTIPQGYDERIVLTNPYDGSIAPDHDVCIDAVGGRFTFSTRGYGRYVMIAP